MKDYQLTTLNNGLRLLTIPMAHVESVTVMVAVNAGSRCEEKKVNGLFHFLEHMAFKGTKSRPTTLDISSAIDGVGGEFNAFTDKEVTAYYLKLAAKNQELAFDILSDMLTHSLFKREEIEREKGVIIEELNMYEDIPMRRIEEIFIRNLYGDNSMGWDIGGEKQTVAKIFRDDFLQVLEKLYFTGNMIVVVAGKVNQEKIEKLVNKYFSGLRKSGQKEIKTIKIHQNKPNFKLVTKKTEQAHFCLGTQGYSYLENDRYPQAVLSAILGGGMSSRLFTEIRERRGLAYYVATSSQAFTDSGYLVTQAGVKLEKIKEALKIVLSEYQDIAFKKVPGKELKRAKEYLKGGVILALEDSKQVAVRFVYQALLEEKIRTPEEVLKLIDKVSISDIQRVACDLLQPQKLNLAIIGPYEDEEKFRKLLMI